MARRLRLTGFARFFIVMLFVAPIAYLAASFYNDADGLENLKNLFQSKDKTTHTTDRYPSSPTDAGDVAQLPELQQTIRKLRDDNLRLMETLQDKEQEIERLRREIERLKSTR
jgi:predicted RNase H-like nuclease (RuvC/YqgF family)